MSYIDLAEFDPKLITCETTHVRPKAGEKTGKTFINLSYGPTKRALAFLTPPIVIDWPYLTGDGNYGTKYGPPDVDKAQYTCGITDKAPPGAQAPTRYFEAMRAIDEALVAHVHANQKELLGSRDESLDFVRAKMNASIKPKYDGDVLAYHRHNLATRKYDWKGNERTLNIVDASRRELATRICHEDVCMVATQLDCVYTGLSGMFGAKWNVVEVMLLARAKKSEPTAFGGTDTWASVPIPSWAEDQNQPAW